MRYAVKNKGNLIRAYELGTGSEMETLLIEESVICEEADGSFRLFSQEAVNGEGQFANKGDFFKVDNVDGRHYPYPNKRDWFLERHIPLGGDCYEQRVVPIPIWTKDDPPCDAVDYLLRSGRLRIDPEDRDHYFNAVLWGVPLSAAEDAVLVFHRLERREDRTISQLSFNFVERKTFDRDYTVCDFGAQAANHNMEPSLPG